MQILVISLILNPDHRRFYSYIKHIYVGSIGEVWLSTGFKGSVREESPHGIEMNIFCKKIAHKGGGRKIYVRGKTTRFFN